MNITQKKVTRKSPIHILEFFKKHQLIVGIFFGIIAVYLAHLGFNYSSTDQFCNICHAHPHVFDSWKRSTHYVNNSGVHVHCVECHLPPDGVRKVTEKARLGIRDVWGTVFKNVSNINWEYKSTIEYARTYIPETSCVRCHAELFSLDLSKKGTDAHVYYFHKKGEVACINCHLSVGHYSEKADITIDLTSKPPEKRNITLPPKPDSPEVFVDYAETIPRTEIVFEMIAIPGGTFRMGSPENESYRREDEGPMREIQISPFWMGKTEVSWDEWNVYFHQNVSTGNYNTKNNLAELDAVTGPTPPYGAPDQGWGMGLRPAITMTHFAAQKYCEWLSSLTGDTYRLPTESEWEYACRGSTTTPYFFDGDPIQFSTRSLKNRIFGADTSVIQRFVWYALNSNGKTHPAYAKQPNPFGLENMLGNVREFCLDFYDAKSYATSSTANVLINPRGPETGTEHVIRGGSFQSDAADLRAAARDFTRTAAWQLTDPQQPKSLWWYSDCFDVGFRVVREYSDKK